jgi:muramoyltetrapeptide carboxypeptidase
MERRSFLLASAGTMAASAKDRGEAPVEARALLKPKPLAAGDTVALITPATYVSSPDALQLARRTVEFLGLKWKAGRNLGKRTGYLGGSVEERVADLHEAFLDPEVKAILCTRGGYGSAMLLDRLDFDLIRNHPKIFIGYSDITALHMGIHQKSGIVTFHGPMALAGFSDYTLEHFKRALFDPRPLGVLSNPPEGQAIRPKHPTRTLRGGQATGALIGGNLTLIASTMGTPWEIQTDGKLLFLEDVGEEPYSMDRMLTQLRLAGKFRNIRGLILGECLECTPRQFQPGFESSFSLGEVYDNVLGDLKVPAFSGLTIGHTDDQLTLPLGVRATLDADAGTLAIEEEALDSRA